MAATVRAQTQSRAPTACRHAKGGEPQAEIFSKAVLPRPRPRQRPRPIIDPMRRGEFAERLVARAPTDSHRARTSRVACCASQCKTSSPAAQLFTTRIVSAQAQSSWYRVRVLAVPGEAKSNVVTPSSGAIDTARPVGSAGLRRSGITEQMLIEMFEVNEKKHRWDMSKPMVWGYFFIDADREKLAAARVRLEAQGYEFVRYLEPDGDEGDLTLHIRRIESHSVKSLLKRNEALYSLAEELGLSSYDGMDVGPIELDPDLKRN